MPFTSDNTNFCNEVCFRIAFRYNANSIKVDMLPHGHREKAGWQKEFRDFSTVYLEHIDSTNAATLAIVDFDKKHMEEVEEYRRRTGSTDTPEPIQQEAAMLFDKLFGIGKEDHPKLLLQLKSMPNLEIPEQSAVKEPERAWDALNGKYVDVVQPCDDECFKIVDIYNGFEAQVLGESPPEPRQSAVGVSRYASRP